MAIVVLFIYWLIGTVICTMSFLKYVFEKNVSFGIRYSDLKDTIGIFALALAFVLFTLLWPVIIARKIKRRLATKKCNPEVEES